MASASKIIAIAGLAALFLSGCSIESKKGDEKKGQNVDIQTPIASMHVETNEQAKAHDTGLAVYPGAREAPPDSNDNTSKANFSLGFAGFGLKVVAAKYVTNDSVDKLKDFYRKELSKYGKVVECQGDLDLNYNKDGKSVSCKGSTKEPDKFEMGVGDGNVQHVVSIEPKGTTNQFGLIYIETHGKNRETM